MIPVAADDGGAIECATMRAIEEVDSKGHVDRLFFAGPF